jgi:NAD(P)-dependent dehydrogenase (short-subunit alcohol dehydrogenase family)
MTEQPQLDTRIVDMGLGELDADLLACVLTSADEEEELRLSDGQVRALRIERCGSSQEAPTLARAPLAAEEYESLDERSGRLRCRPGHFPVARVRPGLDRGPLFRASRSYLVTGGLGGFGLETALWLVARGARHLVLASRRGKPSPADQLALDAAARETGAELRCVALDVTDGRATRALLQRIEEGPAPLAGVFHSAMVLSDVPIAEMSPDDLWRVMRPKSLGAWHLHQATARLSLDYFVMYSSVAAMVGNPGQAAYAAANAYLDGLARLRRSMGLVATSIQWGALAEVGVDAESQRVDAHLRGDGLSPIGSALGLKALEQALNEEVTERGVIDIDWDRWVRTNFEARWNRLELVTSSGGA